MARRIFKVLLVLALVASSVASLCRNVVFAYNKWLNLQNHPGRDIQLSQRSAKTIVRQIPFRVGIGIGILC